VELSPVKDMVDFLDSDRVESIASEIRNAREKGKRDYRNDLLTLDQKLKKDVRQLMR
jgi:hypothetical protein